MQNDNRKKTNLDNADHEGVAHEVSSPVKHGAVIFRIKNRQVVKYAGVQTDVYK